MMKPVYSVVPPNIRTLPKLTRDVLIALVDHIKVYEGGNSIVFRFAGRAAPGAGIHRSQYPGGCVV